MRYLCQYSFSTRHRQKSNWEKVKSYSFALVTQYATIENAYKGFSMKLQLWVRPAFERPGESKGLSGTEKRFELQLLFVENLGFEKILPIFCQFFNFSVYWWGFSISWKTTRHSKFWVLYLHAVMLNLIQNWYWNVLTAVFMLSRLMLSHKTSNFLYTMQVWVKNHVYT